MSNNPYKNEKSSPENKSADTKSTSEKTEEPAKVMLEHGGEMDAAEYDAMLHDALEERELNNTKKQKKLRLITAACFLTLIGSGYAWYATSPSNQEMVHKLWTDTVAMSSEVKDSADVGKIMETYDEATIDKVVSALRQG